MKALVQRYFNNFVSTHKSNRTLTLKHLWVDGGINVGTEFPINMQCPSPEFRSKDFCVKWINQNTFQSTIRRYFNARKSISNSVKATHILQMNHFRSSRGIKIHSGLYRQ